MPKQRRKLEGEVFRRAKVIEYQKMRIETSGTSRAYYLCECLDCGAQLEVSSRDLTHGGKGHMCRECREHPNSLRGATYGHNPDGSINRQKVIFADGRENIPKEKGESYYYRNIKERHINLDS